MIKLIRTLAIFMIIAGYASIYFLPLQIGWCTRILLSGLAIGLYCKTKGLSLILVVFSYIMILDIFALTVIAMVGERKTREVVCNQLLGTVFIIVGCLLIIWGFHETISRNPELWDHGQGHIFIFYSLWGFMFLSKGFDNLFMKRILRVHEGHVLSTGRSGAE